MIPKNPMMIRRMASLSRRSKLGVRPAASNRRQTNAAAPPAGRYTDLMAMNSRRLARIGILASLLTTSALVLAQAPTPAPPAQGNGTPAPPAPPAPGTAAQPPADFRLTVDLVTTDVIVRDQNGQFVANMNKDDFQIMEDGVRQEVASLVLVHGGRVLNQLLPPPPPTQEGIILPPDLETSAPN